LTFSKEVLECLYHGADRFRRGRRR